MLRCFVCQKSSGVTLRPWFEKTACSGCRNYYYKIFDKIYQTIFVLKPDQLASKSYLENVIWNRWVNSTENCSRYTNCLDYSKTCVFKDEILRCLKCRFRKMILSFDPPRTATTKSNEKKFHQLIVIWQGVLGLLKWRINCLSSDFGEKEREVETESNHQKPVNSPESSPNTQMSPNTKMSLNTQMSPNTQICPNTQIQPIHLQTQPIPTFTEHLSKIYSRFLKLNKDPNMHCLIKSRENSAAVNWFFCYSAFKNGQKSKKNAGFAIFVPIFWPFFPTHPNSQRLFQTFRIPQP